MSATGGVELDSANPFIVHRRQLDVHAYALAQGLGDDDYIALVEQTDARIKAVDGVGFVTTPMSQLDLSAELGGSGAVWAKIETGAVGRSHKARHLFGLALRLLIDEAGLDREPSESPDLAIASCGNAAIGAAVVARALKRRLRVFVPSAADPVVINELDGLNADITRCPRDPAVAGDPCVVALDAAIAQGAQAFTVQGPRCPDVLDGGRTLGLELAAQLDELTVVPASIYIQIGGGALAGAVMDGLERAWPGRSLPRFHPVQARDAHPYVAGWRRIAAAVLANPPGDGPDTDRGMAAALSSRLARGEIDATLNEHRALMTAWPDPPESVASGILDDVTYDWVPVMRHQIATGGWPILVDESVFSAAAVVAAAQASPPPDETGAAGLAGLLQHHRDRSEQGPVAEPAVVILTGAAR